jgi:hypothetical protein
MSDFLSRLSERALGVASVARPLIAPLFGPGLTLADPKTAIDLPQWDEVSNQAAATPEEATPSARPVVAQMRMFGLPDTVLMSTLPSTVPELDDAVLPGQIRHLAQINSQEAGSRQAERVPVSMEDKPGPEASKIRVQAASLRSSVVPITPAPRVAANDSSGTSSKIEPTGRRELVNRAEPGPEAPTIRVTIGRVEVRAIVPPALPVARTSPARSGSAPSLEDYLKRRDGDRR